MTGLVASAEGLWPLGPFATAGGLGFLADRTYRRLTRKRALSRTGLELIPSRGFDPTGETLMRLASAMAATRRQGYRVTRSADCIRVALVTVHPGRMGYRLEAPPDILSVLRPHLPADLSVREVAAEDEVLYPFVSRREMVLARPDGSALAQVPLDPDPLTAFAKVFALVQDGEDLCIAFDLSPLSHAHHADVPAERADAVPSVRPKVDVTAAWQQFSRPLEHRAPAVVAKASKTAPQPAATRGSAAPLFHLQVLARARAQDPARAKLLLDALCGAPLAQWASPAGGNWFTPRAVLGHPTGDWPLVREGFDTRLELGTFPRASHTPRVPASEILGLLKPPTAKNGHADLRRSGAASPPPRGLLPLGPGTRPLGHVDGYDAPVGTPWEGFFFSGSSGKTRWGKTSDEICKFLSFVADPPYGMGLGGAFIDPTRDAIGTLEPFMVSCPGRVIRIDLGRSWDDLYLPCWNPFDVRGASDQEANDAKGAVVSSFQAVTRWKPEFASRATGIITNCATALIALARVLPEGGPVPTFFQVPTLLYNPTWREAIMRHLPPHIRNWWHNEYDRVPKDAPLTVTNMISRLRANVPTAAFLGGPSTLNFRHAMDSRSVLLFSTGRKADGEDSLPTSLFVRGMLMGGSSRSDVPKAERARRCPNFLEVFDEAPTYDGPDLASGMQEQAKYGIRAVVIAQGPEKLREGTREAIFTNGSAISTTAVGYTGATTIAREWQGASAADIMDTAQYTFLTSLVWEGRRTPAFLVRPVEPHVLYPQESGALEASIPGDPRYRLASEVVAELDILDDRILEALGETAKPPRDGGLHEVML